MTSKALPTLPLPCYLSRTRVNPCYSKSASPHRFLWSLELASCAECIMARLPAFVVRWYCAHRSQLVCAEQATRSSREGLVCIGDELGRQFPGRGQLSPRPSSPTAGMIMQDTSCRQLRTGPPEKGCCQ